MTGEFGIVYKGYLAGQYTDEVVAIKTIKGINNRHKLITFNYLEVCITFRIH